MGVAAGEGALSTDHLRYYSVNASDEAASEPPGGQRKAALHPGDRSMPVAGDRATKRGVR